MDPTADIVKSTRAPNGDIVQELNNGSGKIITPNGEIINFNSDGKQVDAEGKVIPQNQLPQPILKPGEPNVQVMMNGPQADNLPSSAQPNCRTTSLLSIGAVSPTAGIGQNTAMFGIGEGLVGRMEYSSTTSSSVIIGYFLCQSLRLSHQTFLP